MAVVVGARFEPVFVFAGNADPTTGALLELGNTNPSSPLGFQLSLFCLATPSTILIRLSFPSPARDGWDTVADRPCVFLFPSPPPPTLFACLDEASPCSSSPYSLIARLAVVPFLIEAVAEADVSGGGALPVLRSEVLRDKFAPPVPREADPVRETDALGVIDADIDVFLEIGTTWSVAPSTTSVTTPELS